MATPEDIDRLKALVEASYQDYHPKEKSGFIKRERTAILKLALFYLISRLHWGSYEEAGKILGENPREKYRAESKKSRFDALEYHGGEVSRLAQRSLGEEALKGKSIKGAGTTLGRIKAGQLAYLERDEGSLFGDHKADED